MYIKDKFISLQRAIKHYSKRTLFIDVHIAEAGMWIEFVRAIADTGEPLGAYLNAAFAEFYTKCVLPSE